MTCGGVSLCLHEWGRNAQLRDFSQFVSEIHDSSLSSPRIQGSGFDGGNWNNDMQVEKRRELAVFIFLTFILAPILAVVIVAGYGFLVWMYQLIAGPPSV